MTNKKRTVEFRLVIMAVVPIEDGSTAQYDAAQLVYDGLVMDIELCLARFSPVVVEVMQ